MKPILTLLFCIIFFNAFAQAPGWEWVKKSGGLNSISWDIASDQSGNVFVVGVFDTVVTLGGFTLTRKRDITTLGVFVAKYDATGNALWAKKVSKKSLGFGHFNSNSIVTDKDGNVYVAGSSYAGDSVGNVFLPFGGMYIVKYSPTGQLIWVRTLPTVSEPGKSIATDSLNDIYVVTSFTGSITYDTATFVSQGGIDVFLIKFNANGERVWARSCGSTYDDYPLYIVASISGNAYLTYQAKYPKTVLLKFGPDGDTMWTRNIESTNISSTSITTDVDDNLIISGSYFDTLKIDHTVLAPIASYNVFLAKYDSAGNIIWSRNAVHSATPAVVSHVTVDNSSSRNIYLSGSFNSGSFDPAYQKSSITVGSISLHSTAPSNELIAQFDALGNARWVKKIQVTHGNFTHVSGLTTDPLGNIFVTGSFSGTAVFNAKMITTDSNGRTINSYIAKLSSSTGIEETTKEKEDFTIYPNPTTGDITISFDKNYSDLKLYDALGRIVLSQDIPSQQKEIRLSVAHLANGVYYLQLSAADGYSGKQVIIQK